MHRSELFAPFNRHGYRGVQASFLRFFDLGNLMIVNNYLNDTKAEFFDLAADDFEPFRCGGGHA